MPQLQKQCAESIGTVDGSEILCAPVEVGRLSHYLQGFIHPRWLEMGFLNHPTVLHPLYLHCLKNEQPKHFSTKTSGPRLFAVGDDTSFIGIVF